eukprot:1023865-Pelagomonas_calceolata.AAC.1
MRLFPASFANRSLLFTPPSTCHLQLHIVERRVTLAPNQPWTTLELCVVALSPGWLRVCGATWVLGGAAGGRIEFHPVSKPRSKQQAKSSRCVVKPYYLRLLEEYFGGRTEYLQSAGSAPSSRPRAAGAR